jgi:hypothetical protein
MKLFTTAALALLLTSSLALAQTDGGNDGNTGADGSGGASDGSGNADGGGNYLTGDGPGQFYTDDSMSTMKSEADVKSAWEAMSAEDRENAKKSCAGNNDNRWSTLCNSIGAM